MNSQTVKVAAVKLDENQLWNMLIVMNRHYRQHPNLHQRSDLKEIVDVLMEAVNALNDD